MTNAPLFAGGHGVEHAMDAGVAAGLVLLGGVPGPAARQLKEGRAGRLELVAVVEHRGDRVEADLLAGPDRWDSSTNATGPRLRA